MEIERPDPEQLLRQAKAESKRHGKLKIYFGAVAGAGKTFAMLTDAQEKLREGEKVIAGVVETHGRSETSKLLEGIPLLALREIKYQGITLKEFDLEAALKLKSHIILVDELAHTNAIGSRHPKRWQDVQELIESGIDVYTTLNVQHLESLYDTVANVTGIHVKETIPDSIFDKADEIVLVDVPSEIILERLQEGKVYLGEFAKHRAAQHFFKMENLIALREIALRRTAERVDAQRDVYQKYKDSSKKPVIAEKLLVCISTKTTSAKLIRKAKQQANSLKCPWTVLYVENTQHYRLSKEEQSLLEKKLRLAEQLEASIKILQEDNASDAIANYAIENHFTRILIGSSSTPKWKRFFLSTHVNNLIEKCENIDIFVIHDLDIPIEKSKKLSSLPLYHTWFGFLTTLLVIGICTLVSFPLKGLLQSEVIMIYLTGVVFIAAITEQSAAIFAALLSAFLFHFFFTVPYFSLKFDMDNLKQIITTVALLITGITISSLTSQLRLQNLSTRQREKYTSDLYAFSRKLIVTGGKNKIVRVISQHIGDTFDSAVTVWLPDNTGYLELVSHPGIKAELKEKSVADWAYMHNQVAGLGTDTMPSARGYYIPLSNGEIVLGVLGIIPKDPNKVFSSEETMMLEALALQAALSLERIRVIESQKAKNN